MHGCLTKTPLQTRFWAEPHGLFWREYQPWAPYTPWSYGQNDIPIASAAKRVLTPKEKDMIWSLAYRLRQ